MKLSNPSLLPFNSKSVGEILGVSQTVSKTHPEAPESEGGNAAGPAALSAVW